MASPTQFRHYHIAQDAAGNNIEVLRAAEQVAVLAFDAQRQVFVHCHVLLEPLKNLRSFEETAGMLSDKGHPKLARLLECGEDEGNPYYITEAVDGETLRAYLERKEKLPVWLAIRLTISAMQVTAALLEAEGIPSHHPLEHLRLVQTGANTIQLKMADYRLVDGANSKGAKAKLAQGAFQKQTQFLTAFLKEQLQNKPQGGEVELSTPDFMELLQDLLASCTSGLLDKMKAFCSSMEKLCPAPPMGELAASLKPKPFLAPMLATFQEVARSVVHTVRIQSQKLDAGQPYAMRGMLMKTGQQVLVEQVPPRAMTGPGVAESLRLVQNLPKSGKYPNLVPVNFVEEHEDIECMAETAVEGVSLQDVLDARQQLDVQETYLVLAGLDAALGQLEKAGLATRRLRLEDIFLFTGFAKQNPRESGLLSQKLNEWPGFSIVLRTHPSLHALSGRGTDPAVLLPLELPQSKEAEPIWNGGWMAALGCFLAGMQSAGSGRHETGIPETDTVFRLFDDEVNRIRKGSPSSRGAFLARFARVMQQFDLAQFTKAGGFWTELSGSATAQGHAAEVSRAAETHTPTKRGPVLQTMPGPRSGQAGQTSIGFAEALMRQPDIGAGERAGLRPRAGQDYDEDYEEDPGESSWNNMRESSPFWVRLFMLIFMSLVLGAALAHLSGRAFWQSAKVIPIVVPEEPPKEPEIELPDAPTPAPAAKPKPTSRTSTSSSLPPVAARASSSGPAPIEMDRVPAAIPIADMPGSGGGALGVAPVSLSNNSSTPTKTTPTVQSKTERAALAGDSGAMVSLGQSLLRGDNGRVDERSAFIWFEKALAAGNQAAAVPLAECYQQGTGTSADSEMAVRLLETAAQSGQPAAKDLLGVFYAKGIGTVRNDARAFELCQEAYEAGLPSACLNLGTMYLHGRGVQESAPKSAQLFAEGARRGHAESMLSYAQCLEEGRGIGRSATDATRWYRQAARLGNAEAANWCVTHNVTP